MNLDSMLKEYLDCALHEKKEEILKSIKAEIKNSILERDSEQPRYMKQCQALKYLGCGRTAFKSFCKKYKIVPSITPLGKRYDRYVIDQILMQKSAMKSSLKKTA